MMITTLDIETTFCTNENKQKDLFPYSGKNQLVSVGYLTHTGKSDYLFFYHKDCDPSPHGKDNLQNLLDNTKLLIGHNIKFDLGWLRSCGFKYDKSLYDTMVVEYILARGLYRDFSLDASCKRRKVSQKKGYLIKKFLDSGIGMDKIPPKILLQYGEGDVSCTQELANAQCEILELKLDEFITNN